MGRHTTNSTTAPHEPVAVTITGDAVVPGDYVRVEASGMGRRAVDGLPLAAQNTGAGVTALTGLGATAHVTAVNYGGPGYSGRVLAVLSNGNVACLHTGNGTTSSTTLTCRIYTPLKVQVVSVTVSSATSISYCRVVKLNAGNFAVVWGEGSDLKLAIYTNSGAVVLAATTAVTPGSNFMTRWGVAVLSNGDLVLAYDKPASAGIFFSRYSASGVLQGAETSIEAALSADYICVLPLAAGGFWVYYFRSTAITAYKFARYNASGVQQGSPIVVFTGTSNLNAGLTENYAVELSNGNVALIDPTNATTSAARLYDSTGTFLATAVNFAGLAVGPNYTMLRAKTGGGFYIGAFGAPLVQFDNSGNRLQSSSTQINVLPTRNEGILIDRAGTGPALYYAMDNSGTGNVGAIAFDGTLTAEAAALIVYTTSALTSGLWAELMPCGLLAFTFSNSGIPGASVHGRLAPQAASLLGLATTPGTDGQAVTVATAGRWRANQAFGPTNFDRRSSVPVGCKAVVTGGTQAVLLGIVA